MELSLPIVPARMATMDNGRHVKFIKARGIPLVDQGKGWVHQTLDLSRRDEWIPAKTMLCSKLTATRSLIAQRDERVSGVLLGGRSDCKSQPGRGATPRDMADQVAIAIEDCRLVEENVRWKKIG